MSLVAIDPGSTHSAIVVLDFIDGAPLPQVTIHQIRTNDEILNWMCLSPPHPLVIEMVHGIGATSGDSTFQTARWIGRFEQKWIDKQYAEMGYACAPQLILRRQVKMAACGSMRAKDSDIRRAVIELYGEDWKGDKATPGPLYGVRADEWQALALGLTALNLFR